MRIARKSVEQAAALTRPFGYYLEGGPGPLEAAVRETRLRLFEYASEALEAEYRAIFGLSLGLLFPEAMNLRFPETALFERGLSETPPDPDDLW